MSKSLECELISKEESKNLKGLFALFILLHHILQNFSNAAAVYPVRTGYLWVAGFFLLSGYGIKQCFRQYPYYGRNFIKKRFQKIYVPFLMVTPIYIFVWYVFGVNYSVPQILKSLYGGYVIVCFSWFIFELLALQLIYVSISYLCPKYSNIIMFAVTGLCVYKMVLYGFPFYWYASALAFPAGLLLASYELQLREKLFSSKIAFSVCLIACALFVSDVKYGRLLCIFHIEHQAELDFILGGFLFAGVLGFLLHRWYAPHGKWLCIPARYSFEIYLLQGLFVRGFKRFFVIENDCIYLICAVTMTLSAAVLYAAVRKRIVSAASLRFPALQRRYRVIQFLNRRKHGGETIYGTYR